MAALVLGILGVIVAAVPTAVVALLRTRGGARTGRGLAIAGLVLSAAWIPAIGGTTLLLIRPAEAAVTAVALPVPSPSPSPETSPSPSSPASPATGATPVGFDQLRVGDCLMSPSSPSAATVLRLPCAQPHDEQVYGIRSLGPGGWPGEAAVEGRADEICLTLFDSFVGVPYGDSLLEYTSYTPDMESWQGGDYTVDCVVTDPGTKTVGTLKGSRR